VFQEVGDVGVGDVGVGDVIEAGESDLIDMSSFNTSIIAVSAGPNSPLRTISDNLSSTLS
tara:strand:+ start:384 stop:563 length:180 start_codon:yes stop_codon:yes gene_type:complete